MSRHFFKFRGNLISRMPQNWEIEFNSEWNTWRKWILFDCLRNILVFRKMEKFKSKNQNFFEKNFFISRELYFSDDPLKPRNPRDLVPTKISNIKVPRGTVCNINKHKPHFYNIIVWLTFNCCFVYICHRCWWFILLSYCFQVNI